MCDNINRFKILDSDTESDIENVSQEECDAKKSKNSHITTPVTKVYTEKVDEFINPVQNRKYRYKNKPVFEVKESHEGVESEVYNANNYSEAELGDNLKLNSPWTVWSHMTSNNDWGLTGYEKLYEFDNVGGFWRFFNNFHNINKFDHQYFIFRDRIAPIWEDVNNKTGGICSLMFDINNRRTNNDMVSQISLLFAALMVNECLISEDPHNVNGISISIRRKNLLIKIWTKKFISTEVMERTLPKSFIDKVEKELSIVNNYSVRKTSIQYKPIEPEYDV